MKSLFYMFGKILFWMFTPAFQVLFNNTHRVRLVVVDGKKILVVRNWVGDGRWGLPGGGINKGEGNEAAIVREAREETGLICDQKDLVLFGTVELHEKGYHYTNHYYGLRLGGVSNLGPKREIAEIAWLEPSELTKENAWQDALIGATLVDKL